jgi:hypothetical protein
LEDPYLRLKYFYFKHLAFYRISSKICKAEFTPGCRSKATSYYISGRAADTVNRPAAELSVFSRRAISSKGELGFLYNGDLFAYVERDLEKHIEKAAAPDRIRCTRQ